MKILAAVDFETHPVGPWPDCSPRPVGVAIAPVGGRPQYWRWGHPSGNNCDEAQAGARLKDVYAKYACVFHNAAFDLDVGKTHLGLPYPDEFHDTLILSFLHDPRAQHLGLKEVCDAWLGIAPTERDELRACLLQHELKPSDIYLAPGNVVAPYAGGDVSRTLRLFRFLKPKIAAAGMDEPYHRELRLIPLLIEMTHAGITIARGRLEKDLVQWEREQKQRDNQIRRILLAPTLNIDSGAQLAKALRRAGMVERFIMTDKGNPSVAREALEATVSDQRLLKLLILRNRMAQYINTFAHPWLAQSAQDGKIHPVWNATRRSEENQGFGARTGRLTSSPNLQGIPKLQSLDEGLLSRGDLPDLRDYLTPDDGRVLVDRDYNQQELRLLADFEDGDLKQKYVENPLIDFHDMVSEGVSSILGREVPRRLIKNVVFGILYGAGIKRTATQIGVDYEEARALRHAFLSFCPGVRTLKNEIEQMGKCGEEIRTWGGRLYKVEESRVIDGRVVSFEYRLLNVLIQGSAADCTKEAMLRARQVGCDLRLSVHDELVIVSENGDRLKRTMKNLKEAMESVELDVPMPTDGKWSPRSFGALKPYKD